MRKYRIQIKSVGILYFGLCVFFLVLLACATTPDTEDIKKAEVHYKIGVSYLTDQKLNDAFVEFQKAIKLNPEDKNSLNALGLISTEFEKHDEAISYFKRAIAIDPVYSEATNNLGVTYMRMEKWDEAINYFKMALKNPLYTAPETAYSNMGYAFYKKAEYKSAVDSLKKALLRSPDSPRTIYILGLVYVKLGEDNASIEEFKKAIASAPDYIDAHWELGNAYLRVGDREKAVEHFKVVAKSSNDERSKKALRYIEVIKNY